MVQIKSKPEVFADVIVGALVSMCKDNFKFEKIKIEGTVGITIDDGDLIFIHMSDCVSSEDVISDNESQCVDIDDKEKVKADIKPEKDEPSVVDSSSNDESECISDTSKIMTRSMLKSFKHEAGATDVGDAHTKSVQSPLDSSGNFSDNDDKTTIIYPDEYLIPPEALKQYESKGFFKYGKKQGSQQIQIIVPDDDDVDDMVKNDQEEMDIDSDEDELDADEKKSRNDVMDVLLAYGSGLEVLKEYEETGTIVKNKTLLVKVLVANLVKESTLDPTSEEKKALARNIVSTFPCLKSPGPLGYEHFYTPLTKYPDGKKKAAGGYIEERLKSLRRWVKKKGEIEK